MDRALIPYVTLVKTIERELDLASSRDFAAVHESVARRGNLLMTLPSVAPAGAEPWILRAQALHSRLIIEMRRVEAEFERRRVARSRARILGRTYVRPARRHSTSASY